MKQKKAHASHPVGNRTVIGIICIVVALAICFGIAPLVNRLSDGKTKIVRLTRDISAGATITEADIEVVDVGSYNLPTGVIRDKAQVVGKCALSSLSKGDYLFPSKIGNDTNNSGRMLESLDENHKAISITIGSFALGFCLSHLLFSACSRSRFASEAHTRTHYRGSHALCLPETDTTR